MLLVNKADYQNAIDNLMAAQRVSTRTDYELTSQNWDKVYASHRASTSTGTSGSHLNVGNFNFYSNSKIEALNQRIEHEAGVANLEPVLGGGLSRPSLGDIFGTGTGNTTPGHGTFTGTTNPTITNPGTFIRPATSSRLTNTANNGVILTNSANLNSGVLANNNLNAGLLEVNANLETNKNMTTGNRGRLRSSSANSNSNDNTAATGSTTIQARGQLNGSLSNSSSSNNLNVTSLNARNLVKRESNTIQRKGQIVISDNTSNSATTINGNTVVVNTSLVRIPSTSNSNSTGGSITGVYHPVINTSDNRLSNGSHNGLLPTLVATTTTDNVSVEDYQYEKLREDYTDQGSDTSMLYERKSLEEYTIAYQLGDTIYDLCFKTDPNYSTYEELFTNIMACYNSGISASGPSSSASSSVFPIMTSSSTAQRFGWYSYLFVPQTPNDANRYNTNVKLPAIAAFVLSTAEEHRTAAMAKHLFLMTQFSMMRDYSNLYTNAPIKKIPHQNDHVGSYRDDFSINGSWDDIDCDYNQDFFNGTQGGIIRDYSKSWKNLDLRSYTVSRRASTNPDMFEPCGQILGHGLTLPDEYRTYFAQQYWAVPNLLEVSTTRSKTAVITIKSFGEKQSDWEDYNGSRNSIATVTITDKATPAMYDDIKMFFDFFKKCTEIAAYPLNRGYSHKKNILKKLYSADYAHACLQFDNDFPYTINKSLPWTHYFNAWNNLYTLGNDFNPNASNPETMHVSRASYQFYSWLWFHYKKAPNTWEGTKGMTVVFDDKDGRTLPNWYSNMNNLATNDKPYVKIVYASGGDNSTTIARQIKTNLFGSGEDIHDSAYNFNKTVSRSWKLNNYKKDATWTTKDNNTQKLTFPDYKNVEAYIDD